MSWKAFSLFSLFNDCINVLSQPFSIIATKMSSFLSVSTTDCASVSVEVPGETEVDRFELLFLLPVLSLTSCLESVFTVAVVASILSLLRPDSNIKNLRRRMFFVQFHSTVFFLLVSQQKVC